MLSGSRPRILVVEDETIVAMDIERGLTTLGYEVVGTTGIGADAIRLAEQHRPDLVLMDIRLQGTMDGIEAGQQIRRSLGIPILFLTAHADTGTVERAKAAEPFGYLLKPFEDQELHTAIEIALHKRRVEQTTLADADEALRQSEQRFRLLVESLRDYAVFLLNSQGSIASWNQGAQRILGYHEAEVIGQHFSMFYRPEEIVRNQPDQLLWTAVREGQAHEEGWCLRKGGSPIWAEAVVSALRDKEGQLVGFAKITRDITERKAAVEAIRELNASLERRVQERTAELNAANRELEAFTYSVAHDLRSPLRGLRGFLGFLQEEIGPGLSAAAAEYLGRGQNCAERMAQLVDDLLHLSSLGRQPLVCRAMPLNALVQEVRAELSAETKDRQILWEIEPLPTVDCDPGLMKQVFANLLGNALKYTRPRDLAVIHVGRLAASSTFYVRDNGVGFDMQYADKLFRPFSRLHSADQFPGTGIGLATVERIIRKHGGRIWAESEEGKGATFYFTVGSGGRTAPAALAASAASAPHTTLSPS